MFSYYNKQLLSTLGWVLYRLDANKKCQVSLGVKYKNTNRQNTKRTYGQTSEQLFPKRWSLSNPNRTRNMNTRKVKRHLNSDTKTGNLNHNRTTGVERSVINYLGMGLNIFHGANLALSFRQGVIPCTIKLV